MALVSMKEMLQKGKQEGYAIGQFNINNLELINKIQMLLEQRLDWLSDREPESSGLTYDLWSDKFNDLQEILDYIEELKEETDTRKQKELLEEIKNRIDEYQLVYGGLSRLKVYY